MTQSFHLEVFTPKKQKICSHKDLYTNVTSNFACNSQNRNTTQMFINILADEQILVYTCNGIVLGKKNEWNIDMHNNMDESQNYVERKNPLDRSGIKNGNRELFLTFFPQAKLPFLLCRWCCRGIQINSLKGRITHTLRGDFYKEGWLYKIIPHGSTPHIKKSVLGGIIMSLW